MMLTHDVLSELSKKFCFNYNDEEHVLFAIRGCLPATCYNGRVEEGGHLRKKHEIVEKELDYKNFSCSIGMWCLSSQTLAIFPGSTVPSLPYLTRSPAAREHYNILCPGKYKLEKGVHPRVEDGFERHPAFLMEEKGWVCRPGLINNRAGTDFNFKKLKYEVLFPGDNLHASRSEPTNTLNRKLTYRIFLNSGYSSSGCMTIAGQPAEYTRVRGASFFWNSWEQAIHLIKEESAQNEFPFLLFEYDDLVDLEKETEDHCLRFGSSGPLVEKIQLQLKEIQSHRLKRPYYTGSIDGHFDEYTATAYLEYVSDFPNKLSRSQLELTSFLKSTQHFVFTINQL